MNKKYKLLNRYSTSALLVLLIVGVATALVTISHKPAEAVATDKTASQLPQKTSGAPQFSFDAAAAPGWRQGATDKVSMALFHQYDCFTSVEHKSGQVNIATALQKSQDTLAKSGYAVTPGKTQTLVLQTNIGPLKYELHQSSVVSPPGHDKVKGGQEFGYVQLSSGYVKIMGYCDTAVQLPTTIPALQAIKLDAAD